MDLMNRISNLRGTVMSLEFRVEKKKEQRQKCQGQLWKFMYSSFFLRKKKRVFIQCVAF